jgi:hypothetical protein
MTAGSPVFECGMFVFPQPVAIACRRICRAGTAQERLEAVLKCAEVVTRYLAAVSLEEAGRVADRLITNGLAAAREERLCLRKHLKELAAEARSQPQSSAGDPS